VPKFSTFHVFRAGFQPDGSGFDSPAAYHNSPIQPCGIPGVVIPTAGDPPSCGLEIGSGREIAGAWLSRDFAEQQEARDTSVRVTARGNPLYADGANDPADVVDLCSIVMSELRRRG
jgi:hypothetical protein